MYKLRCSYEVGRGMYYRELLASKYGSAAAAMLFTAVDAIVPEKATRSLHTIAE
jgi:hypothetical protein